MLYIIQTYFYFLCTMLNVLFEVYHTQGLFLDLDMGLVLAELNVGDGIKVTSFSHSYLAANLL